MGSEKRTGQRADEEEVKTSTADMAGPAAAAERAAEDGQKPPRRRNFIKRNALVVSALIVALVMVGSAAGYASLRRHSLASSGKAFDPATVLPQAVSQPPATTVYTAASLKQYDGQNGHKCYVAVDGTVYEIKDNAYWQDGKHTPSGGQAFCGADMSQAIKQSPHGDSVLSSLPKVGIYK